MSYLTLFSYHLILVSIQQTPEVICEFVETIRKLVETLVIVLAPVIAVDRFEIIQAGADVVLTEDCESAEIALQAYALIRRFRTLKAKKTEICIIAGPLEVNLFGRQVYWNHIPIPVVRREFDFLYLLAATPGRVYTYSQIYQIVWQEHMHDDITNMIYCMVYRLKNNLKKADIQAYDIICSVKEVGYYLKIQNV